MDNHKCSRCNVELVRVGPTTYSCPICKKKFCIAFLPLPDMKVPEIKMPDIKISPMPKINIPLINPNLSKNIKIQFNVSEEVIKEIKHNINKMINFR